MRIVFMGTSEFSIPALNALLNTKHEIVSVYTKKPKRADRGQQLQYSPIYKIAQKNNLITHTPLTFKHGKNLEPLQELKPDLIVVVSYGLILTKEVLSIPKYGAINIHPSLLPRWRGCAPLERCLLSNDTKTGVCIMEVEEGLDSGCILKKYEMDITKDTDIEYLKEHLSEKGAELLVEAIDDIEKNGKIIGIKQDDSLATFADMITNDDAKIDWQNDSIVLIDKKIKTLWSSVGVFINHNGNKLKVLKADFELQQNVNKDNIGKIIDKKHFFVQCKDGILKPLIIQREGKKAMQVADFVNGYKININDIIL